MEDLDALQPNHVLNVIDSADSVSRIVLPLKSILEYIPIPAYALQILESTIETAKDVSSLQWMRLPMLKYVSFCLSSIR